MSGSLSNPSGYTGTSSDMASYDPATHENQIVAVYGEVSQAHSARDMLTNAGVPSSAIQVIDHAAGGATAGNVGTSDTGGFWDAMKNLFVPEDETHAYSHAVGQGHALLVVTPDGTVDRQRIVQILESTDPIDFDAKLNEWKQSGYDYSQPHNASFGSLAGGAASAAAMTAGTPGTTATTAGLESTDTTARTGRTGTAAAMTGTGLREGEDTVKVMEERLRVGKREVAGGAVRVRSYVVERPVEEQVRLREERVTLERRPVDRPVTAEDLGAFQEKTIEASGFTEEAVVSKDARVVEEIGIRREAGERVETVRDTVRKTEVEVEDGTTGNVGTSRVGTTSTGTGSMGTGGTTTNATPGATTSGTNSPRR